MFTPEALASYLSAALVTVINLLVAYFVLKHFLFRPILKLLRKRRQTISDDLLDAEQKLADAQNKQNQATEKLEESTHEAADILNEARSQADSQRETIIAEAKRQAAGMLTRAENEVSRMRITMLNEVRNEVADLSINIASKVVGKIMDEHRQRELVEQLLDTEMPVQTPSGSGAKTQEHSEVAEHG